MKKTQKTQPQEKTANVVKFPRVVRESTKFEITVNPTPDITKAFHRLGVLTNDVAKEQHCEVTTNEIHLVRDGELWHLTAEVVGVRSY